jgi:hypothetical protein
MCYVQLNIVHCLRYFIQKLALLVCWKIFIYYCTMLGSLDHFWSPVVRVTPLKTPVRLLIGLFTIPTTHNYIHSQLFLTLCHIYTAYNHTRLWLQSLITLLHWLTSQLSITVSNYHTLYIFAFYVSVSYRDLTPLENCYLQTDSQDCSLQTPLKNWLLKTELKLLTTSLI